MSQHSDSNCKQETGLNVESALNVEETEVEKQHIASEWDENDLELCIINSQEEQSSMSEPMDTNNKDKSGKAHWLPHAEETLFNILRQYIEDKRVSMKEWNVGSFRRSDWKSVTEEFNKATGMQMTVEQIMNKKKSWKQLYGKYKRVREQSGVGWNNEKRTFIIPNWDVIESVLSLKLQVMGASSSSGNSDARQLGRPREEVVREVYDRLTHVVEERILNARTVAQRQYDCEFTGPMYTDWVLNGHPRNLPDVFHIDHASFFQLRDALLNGGYFVPGHKGVQIEEALLIFLSVVCGDGRFRTVCQRYQHSSDTITRTVRKVRKAIVRLSAVLICPMNEHVVHPRIRNDARLYPYFKDCIGAIDGTHIEAAVTPSESTAYRNRHASVSQNVLGVVDNSRRFVYVFVGMGGSAHDARVLDTAMEQRHMFPLPPVGKYYAADSAYQSKPGFMCPFRNKHYHHTEHTGRGFRDKEELFNHRHSSTRNIVERVFGILKRKFQFLVGPTYNFDLQAQGEFVLACCTIHNLILLHNPDDPQLYEPDDHVFEFDGGEDYGWTIPTCHLQPGDHSRQAINEWNLHRNHIADSMWVNHNAP